MMAMLTKGGEKEGNVVGSGFCVTVSSCANLCLGMTSCVYPLTLWTDSPLSRVTQALCSDEGSVVVTSLENGNLLTYESTSDVNGFLQLKPRVLLVGRGARISAMALCRIDVDGAATRDNVIVTGDASGEVVLWDIADGRALLAASAVFPASIIHISVVASGRFLLCAGHSDCIVVLHAASLEVARVIQNIDGWTGSLGVLITGPQTPDYVFRGGISGAFSTYLFDEGNLDLVHVGDTPLTDSTANVGNASNVSSDFGGVLAICVSRFGPNLIVAVKRKACYILRRDQGAVRTICTIHCMERGTGWGGAQFLSARTVLLWTQNGVAVTYFIGHASQLACGSQSQMANGGSVVLASDGDTVCALSSGTTSASDDPANGTSAFAAISSFHASKQYPGSTLCVIDTDATTTQNPKHLVVFHNSPHLVSYWPFWANIGWGAAQMLREQYPLCVASAAEDADTASAGGMVRFRRTYELDLSEAWREVAEAGFRITSAALVSDKLIAIGCDTGKIYVVPITDPFFYPIAEFETHAAWILSGHIGAVTALFQADFTASGGKCILVSGGVDQTIKIWNLELGTMMASMVCHSQRVKVFLPVPTQSGMKVKHGIISVADDQSIAVIDLDSLQSIHILTGHSQPISAIHWRSQEETMLVQCSNLEGTLYIWQLKTGHLDRIEEGELAEDIVSCCDRSVVLSDYSQDYLNSTTRQAFSAFSIKSGFEEKPIMFVLLINLKRFINDIYGGQYSLTPPSTPPQARSRARSPARHHGTTGASNVEPESPTKTLTVPQLLKVSSRARMGSGSSIHSTSGNASPTTTRVSSDRPRSSGAIAAENQIAEATVAPAPPRGPADKNLVRGILSATMSWGLDAEVDHICRDVFELYAASNLVSVGSRGANGYISIPAPSGRASNTEWTLSPTMSASRMLQLVSLVRTFGIKKEYERDVSATISRLCSIAPSETFPLYQNPSFSFLAKYWQDQIVDVQQASRIIFSSTLRNMPVSEKDIVVDYWKSFLPSMSSASKKNSKTNLRAAILMGVIGCEDASLLSVRLCKDVAESLDILLKEDIRGPYRMLAVELLGRGFKTWEPHVNASNVLRAIISTTGLQSPSTPNTPSRDAGGSQSGISPSSALVMVSRQAVVQIASINPGLFITTVTFDFVHSKNVSERVGGLKLLGMFIAKKPLLLYSHVPRIIESMVKSLDPNVPGMREAVQTVVTSNFAELVKTFPNVAFHHGTQKLAVGTTEGLTIVYDLKTATKGQVLEGHSKPVTAVAFSPDGKLSVTFSLEENCVRFWQLSTGFLNSLASAFSGASQATGAAGHMKSFRDFMAGAPQKPNPTANFDIKFEWLTDRSVKLHSVDEIKLVFTV
ncbi:hypothetical protein BC830DRAFT_1149503 [Chytriomyces sp. MP71]|nr:hypothetical protein BC830DRAFT_1149503 [Chytriomyces sp. MP71]